MEYLCLCVEFIVWARPSLVPPSTCRPLFLCSIFMSIPCATTKAAGFSLWYVCNEYIKYVNRKVLPIIHSDELVAGKKRSRNRARKKFRSTCVCVSVELCYARATYLMPHNMNEIAFATFHISCTHINSPHLNTYYKCTIDEHERNRLILRRTELKSRRERRRLNEWGW